MKIELLRRALKYPSGRRFAPTVLRTENHQWFFALSSAGRSAAGFPDGYFNARILGFALLLLLFATAAFAQTATLTVGSKRFAESRILGEILTQTAQGIGEAQTYHQSGLGNTGIVFAALKSGSIDVYPEYTGTIGQELLQSKTPLDLPAMNARLAPLGLAAGVPLGFNDTYALAMRDDQAEKLGIKTLSDLAKHSKLKLGLSQEFLKRADGWPGVKAAYGLPFESPQGLDHGLAYEAIAGGQIDVTDIYSTDSKIAKYQAARVWTDDKTLFSRLRAPSCCTEATCPSACRAPGRLFRHWQGQNHNAPQMTALNARSGTAKRQDAAGGRRRVIFQRKSAVRPRRQAKPPMAIASGRPCSRPDFWPATRQHLFLVFVSLLFSILVGIPLGIWAARTFLPPRSPILSGDGAYSDHSLAGPARAALIPLLHQIGAVPAIIALFLYSLLPIVRNTYTGLTDIAPGLRESAAAHWGCHPGARLRLIELPLAARAIFAGIKTAAVINVGTATIAAFIGAGGYGNRISQGLENNSYDLMLLSGAIPAAALALLVQYGF